MQDRWSQLLPWLPVFAGLVALYVPTLYDLFNGIWASDEQMHGPIVLCISFWLLYRNWAKMTEVADEPSAWGWLLVAIALLAYVIGNSQGIVLLEVGSVVWMITGVLLLNVGWRGVKTQWFALFFMLFMIPLPGALVLLITMPMKMAVSFFAEHVLYAAGYPIGRSGVVLQIGQYMLLVADACAGLHTLLTLEALGLLYLNLVRRDSAFRNITLALLIVPISFTANVIRVIALSLITYHFGNEAGQGFLHGFAGMVLFMSALLLIISFDSFLLFIENLRTKVRPPNKTEIGS